MVSQECLPQNVRRWDAVLILQQKPATIHWMVRLLSSETWQLKLSFELLIENLSLVTLVTLECTGDQHFVFAIRSNTANINVDPKKLVIPGFPNCKPVIVNDKVAIFKFKVTDCGARYYVSCPLTMQFSQHKARNITF